MAVMENHKARFESKTDNIPVVESLVDEVCEENHIDQDYYGNILIAVTEAVNNAIQHGNKQDPSKSFDLLIDSQENQLVFTVSDEGEGFDFENLPDPTEPGNIDKPHGRGIFLMKHLADEVEFSDEGRTVALKFQTPAN